MNFDTRRGGCGTTAKFAIDVDSPTPVSEKVAVQTLLAAFKYLTVWEFVATKPPPELIGKSAPFFPLVGFVLGLPLVLLNYLLTPYLALEIINLAAVALLIATTGGQHLQGLKETFRVREGDQHGRADESLGIAAIILAILFKSAAANSMDERLTLSLLLMPVFARWTLAIFLYGYGSRFDEFSRRLAEHIRFWPLLVSTAITLAVVVYLLGRKVLWVALFVSLFVLCLRVVLYRRRGVISQAEVRGHVELAETLVLILLASL